VYPICIFWEKSETPTDMETPIKVPNCSTNIFVKATCVLAKFKYLSYSQFFQHGRHNTTRNNDITSTPKLLESVWFPLKIIKNWKIQRR